MKPNLVNLLKCAEEEMATATYQKLKDFEAELREIYNHPAHMKPKTRLELIKEILGETET